MYRTNTLALALAASFWIASCGDSANDHAGQDGQNTHADETVHQDSDHLEETPLPSAKIGDLTVELAQAHGAVQAGKESHLVVKLPYNDRGATVVRAWIGTEDRTLSMVGKGEYDASHGDYNIHCNAPNPLPDNAMWWIEIEKPDGTKLLGTTKPLTN